MVRVLIANYQKKRVGLKRVRSIVSEVLKKEGVESGEVSIVLSDDKFIKDLNYRFRGVDEPTDVLAFEYGQKASPFFLGEIIVSIDTCIKQAKEYKVSFKRELSLLLIHGVLHLLGYDHKDEENGSLMREKEKELLAQFEI